MNFALRPILTSSLVLFATMSASLADTKSVFYANASGWTVEAVYDVPSSQFSFCVANAIYRDETNFAISLNRTGEWFLIFYNNAWSSSNTGAFPVNIIVDGKIIDRTDASWLAKGALIKFGDAPEKVVALMRGRVLTVATSSGTSRFSLDGSFKAALAVAACAELHSGQQARDNGAFGNKPVAQNETEGANKLPRSLTLEVAAEYLGKWNVPYRILPQSENFFTNLPVNWKYGEHSVGGMLVLTGSGLSGEQTFVSILQDHTKICTGKSGIVRETPERAGDSMIYKARGVCQENTETFEISYIVLEGNEFVIIVLELLDGIDARSYPTIKKQPEVSGDLMARFTPQ